MKFKMAITGSKKYNVTEKLTRYGNKKDIGSFP